MVCPRLSGNREPQLDPSGGPPCSRRRWTCTAEDLGYEWWGSLADESLNGGVSGDEGLGQFFRGGLADEHEEGDPIRDHGLQFIWLIANPAVVCDGNPTAFANCGEPLFVGGPRAEVIVVALDGQPSIAENLREPLAQVPVCEVDKAQAARSYSTACSMSAAVRS